MLYFQNNYARTLWLALMYRDLGKCGSDRPWRSAGWYVINPGNKIGFFGNLNNRYYYYYAHTQNNIKWEGSYTAIVYQRAFESCQVPGSGAYKVGMRQIDVGNYDDYTMTLYYSG